jgi:hypothetical protein
MRFLVILIFDVMKCAVKFNVMKCAVKRGNVSAVA